MGIYDLIVIPLQVFEPPEVIFTTLMTWFTCIFWTFDMPMSFITGFHVSGQTELRPGKIILHYLRSWFLFDVVVLSIDWALTVYGQVLKTRTSASDIGYVRMGRTARFVRMLRLLRLLRLLKVQGKLAELLESIQSKSVRIILGIVKLIV